jgi:ribonuclease P protein component
VKQFFTYDQRLHESDLFLNALKKKALVENWFALHFVQNRVNINRLGIIVSKRIIAKSHDRNRIKRYIREAFRKNLTNSINTYDIVVRLKTDVYVSEKVEFFQAICRLIREVGLSDYETPHYFIDQSISISD